MRYRESGLLVLAVMLADCAHRHGAETSVPEEPTTATITVTNDNWLDIEVYLVSGGTTSRLGDVSTSQTLSFEVPPHRLGQGSFRIRAHPVGSSGDYYSPTISLSPGHNLIDLRVDNVISHSTMTFGLERN